MRKFPLLFLLFVSIASADVVTLQDGSRIEGDVKRSPEGWNITLNDGSVKTVAPDSVKSIQLGSSSKDSSQSAEGLASLRRSVEAITDIGQIIDRYQRFIDNTKDAKVRADAQSDLSIWQQRKDQKLVKRGSKWVTSDEAAELAAKANDVAVQARDLIRQNRNRDADQLLQQALAGDPANPAALYLRGVLLFRTDKFVDAKKTFDAANLASPAHAPILNNLAVISWHQNQQAAAMNFYDQAMLAQPINKFILDNVAQAIGTLPEDQRKSPAAVRALKRFSEQDTLLQQQQAKDGLYRWGGTWVDQKQLDDLKVAEKQVHEKMAAMQKDFDDAKARIADLDSQMSENQTLMNDLQIRAVLRDSKGNVVSTPLPQSYYDLQAKNSQLLAEEGSLKAKLATLQDQAQHIQQEIPVPRFTGLQQIVGVEGMPEISQSAAPTSQP
jgi:Flp pilus assembly protein TadD